MPVKLFRGRGTAGDQEPQEFAQIKEIYCKLSEYYRDQTIFMIIYLRYEKGEIDCLLLRPNGPVILEAKAYCGTIYGMPNDKVWSVINSQGEKVKLNCNLFTQATRHRWYIIDKFKEKIPKLIDDIAENKLYYVPSWGYFKRDSVYAPNQVDMAIAKWFNIVTIDTLIEQLETNNSGYTLFEKDLQSIVDDFHVEPYTISCPNSDLIKKVHEEAMDHKSEKPTVHSAPRKGLVQASKKISPRVKNFIAFDSIWNNIVQNSSEEFQTIEGFKFTYTINNADLIPSLQGWEEIPRSDFEMAHAFGVCDNPECYGTLFTGGKLIWAILHDTRINS